MLKILALCVVSLLFFTSFSGVFALEGTQRVEIKNPRLVDSFGQQMSENINVNQQVQISADVINKQGKNQSFVYLVQIVDKNKVSQRLVWFSASLNPNQTFAPAISWSTQIPGTYTAEIYVWDSIKDAAALASPIEMKILVS